MLARDYTGKDVTVMTSCGTIIRGKVKIQHVGSLVLEAGAGIVGDTTYQSIEISRPLITAICVK